MDLEVKEEVEASQDLPFNNSTWVVHSSGAGEETSSESLRTKTALNNRQDAESKKKKKTKISQTHSSEASNTALATLMVDEAGSNSRKSKTSKKLSKRSAIAAVLTAASSSC